MLRLLLLVVVIIKIKRSKNYRASRIPTRLTNYLTPKARLALTQLGKAFTKALILQYFNLDCHIRIETNTSGYAINRILSQLTLDNLGQWYPVAYYSQKIILAKTRYKIHNNIILAIVEAFKTWRHYLKGYKYNVLVLKNHNNLCRFMDMKNLSFCQVWWAEKLFGIIFGLMIIKARQTEL